VTVGPSIASWHTQPAMSVGHTPISRYICRIMTLHIELERETDGRWVAEVPELAGVLAYGSTRDEALGKVQALALRVIAERLEHGEEAPDLLQLTFRAA